ncbi:MAG TPA: hypothetical protein P5337_09780 [Aestuariivirga sp.]|nr:hypothetical protein [Aestuariivirga sp.]
MTRRLRPPALPPMTARARPLAACPDFNCRRGGACLHALLGVACLRTHESEDDARDQLAAKLDAIGAGRRPVGPPAEGYALELRLADIKRWLEAEEARWAALAAAEDEP